MTKDLVLPHKLLKTNWSFFSSDEEKFPVTSVKSADDVVLFKGLQLESNLSIFETVQLINRSLVKLCVIKSKLPWHVIGTVSFVIDNSSLKNHLDRRRELHETRTSSRADISEELGIHFVSDSSKIESSDVIIITLTIMSLRDKC